ncbi:MAG: sigma 54-interacting transcriptional regulator [Gammaproteobacteria bacterium]
MTDTAKPSCEQIIDILPGPFVVIDRDYQILAANRAYLSRYGVSIGEIVGHHCYEISHRSSVPCSQHGEHCPLETVFATGQPTQVMHVHYDRDGQEEYVQLQAAPIFDNDGHVLYMGEYVQVVSQANDDDWALVGRSRPLLRLTSLLQRVAPTLTTVLLLGESGVGKERVASYLHHYSDRSRQPFVVVDCGTLGEHLIESELFGHEKGAFTGASSRKKGLFEVADGGTLFIDEICELPLHLQTKLLRVLESGTIRRLGGTEYIKVDVRVLAATNRNMQAMVAEEQFRQDLYYRLSAFPVHVPSLRERKDDIVALAEHFLSNLPNGDLHLPLSAEVIETLLAHDYPGNVRELRNVIERATILASDDIMCPEHIVFEGGGPVAQEHTGAEAASTGAQAALLSRRDRLTDEAILDALERCDGHRAHAARMLGVSERTLYRHVRRIRGTGG